MTRMVASLSALLLSIVLLVSYGVGSVIGPIVMAELINLMGPKGLFVGNAGFLLILAVITSLRITYTADVPIEDQEQYVPAMPETSAVLTEIDPRNTEFHAHAEAEKINEAPAH